MGTSPRSGKTFGGSCGAASPVRCVVRGRISQACPRIGLTRGGGSARSAARVPYTPPVPPSPAPSTHRPIAARSLARRARPVVPTLLAAALALAGSGCTFVRSDPAKATRQYPFWLPLGETIDAQVITEGETMVIVNATTRSFSDVDVWLNERYMCHVDSLAAGENRRLGMGEFWDIRGEGPNPGGIFRYYRPTPVRLVQIQVDNEQPLVGLKAVLTETESR